MVSSRVGSPEDAPVSAATDIAHSTDDSAISASSDAIGAPCSSRAQYTGSHIHAGSSRKNPGCSST